MTLLEIMIVIFIIGLVGSVITVNMRSSLEEGKSFRSQQGSKQIFEVLCLEMARHDISAETAAKDYSKILKDSGLIKNVPKMLHDGWGESYIISHNNDEVFVTSKKLIAYMKSKGKSQTAINNELPWMDDPSTT